MAKRSYYPRPSRRRNDITLNKVEELRLKYPGSTGRPYPPVGGLKTIAKILGCSKTTVLRRLIEAAEQEE